MDKYRIPKEYIEVEITETLVMEELQQHKVKETVEALRRKYDVFRSASEVARNTLECNLHAIERIQRAQDAPPEEEHPRLADFRV